MKQTLGNGCAVTPGLECCCLRGGDWGFMRGNRKLADSKTPPHREVHVKYRQSLFEGQFIRPAEDRRGTQEAMARLPWAFTLIELLVVVAIASVLLGIMLPAIRGSREAARHAACASNLRGLSTCNAMYADDFKGRYAPGAANFVQNQSRWHGTRANPSERFHAAGGSLSEYIGGEQADDGARAIGVRMCPSFTGVLEELNRAGAGFEAGCGGYGYNNVFIGTQRRRISVGAGGGAWVVRTDLTGSLVSAFARPTRTVEFADSAFATELGAGWGEGAGGVIEYSFVEPRVWPDAPSSRADPSMHFRHGAARDSSGRAAGVAWLDGHVSAERFTDTWSGELFGVDERGVRRLGIGWFGPDALNEVFDYD